MLLERKGEAGEIGNTVDVRSHCLEEKWPIPNSNPSNIWAPEKQKPIVEVSFPSSLDQQICAQHSDSGWLQATGSLQTC